jgi:hypothetical protein
MLPHKPHALEALGTHYEPQLFKLDVIAIMPVVNTIPFSLSFLFYFLFPLFLFTYLYILVFLPLSVYIIFIIF